MRVAFQPLRPRQSHLNVPRPTLPLTWYLVFFAVFTLFPFVFLKKFADKTPPWAAAALARPAAIFSSSSGS